MQRKRRKKKRFGVFLFLLVVCIGIGIMFVPWAMQPENFREVKNKINGFLYKEDFPDSPVAGPLYAWTSKNKICLLNYDKYILFFNAKRCILCLKKMIVR